VFEDIPVGFARNVKAFCAEMPTRLDQYEAILNRNEIFLERTRNVGIVSRERLLDLGVTDRCSGPQASRGTSARRRPRIATAISTSTSRWERSATATTATGSESRRCASRCASSSRPSMAFRRGRGSPTTGRSSSRPGRALDLDGGTDPPLQARDRGIPGASGRGVLRGRIPRGELGCFVVADGSAKPARVHIRDPSFVNLQCLRDQCLDGYIADLIQNLAMLDPILGGSTDEALGDPNDSTEGRRIDGNRASETRDSRRPLADPGLCFAYGNKLQSRPGHLRRCRRCWGGTR